MSMSLRTTSAPHEPPAETATRATVRDLKLSDHVLPRTAPCHTATTSVARYAAASRAMKAVHAGPREDDHEEGMVLMSADPVQGGQGRQGETNGEWRESEG
jgi:hypothetical protein